MEWLGLISSRLRRFGRLALALSLACVLLAGAAWAGQGLRLLRSDPLVSSEPDAAGGAASARAARQWLQFVELDGIDPMSLTPSPDGAYLVGRTVATPAVVTMTPEAGGKPGGTLVGPGPSRTVLLRIVPDADAIRVRTDVVASWPDIGFAGWLPDGRAFLGQGQTVVTPPAGAKAQMKTYELFVITIAGDRTKIGEVFGGAAVGIALDGKSIAAFTGEPRLQVLSTSGGPVQLPRDPTGGSSPALLGWDGAGNIVRADYREPFALHRIPLSGAPATMQLPGITSVSNARWSPDHRAAIVNVARQGGERDGLLTDTVGDLPADALRAWVGPHQLLTRGRDERAGTVDVLTGARTALGSKMRSERLRILAVSPPNVLWVDESTDRLHILDVASDRESGIGIPVPTRAEPLAGGGFLLTRDTEVTLIDGAAWWSQVPATPSPIPTAMDQSGAPAGWMRVIKPEGGWSVLMPQAWYRRDAPMRGSEILSYDPTGMDLSGNVPPAGEVRVVIELMPDRGHRDLAEFARAEYVHLGDELLSEGIAEAPLTGSATRTAYTAIVRRSAAFSTREVRYWLERSPYFPDRVAVIEVHPASAHPGEIPLLMKSLRFTQPAADAQATVTRGQVTAMFDKTSPSAKRVDKVVAKLVRWKEYEGAANFGRSYVNDPDQLVWVVIVMGEIDSSARRLGPPGYSAAPATYAWELHVVDAINGFPFAYSCCGTDPRPPAWFDALVDLAR